MNKIFQDDLKVLYNLKTTKLPSIFMDLTQNAQEVDILTDFSNISVAADSKSNILLTKPYLLSIPSKKQKTYKKIKKQKYYLQKSIRKTKKLTRLLKKRTDTTLCSYHIDLPPPSPSLSDDSGVDMSQDLIHLSQSMEVRSPCKPKNLSSNSKLSQTAETKNSVSLILNDIYLKKENGLNSCEKEVVLVESDSSSNEKSKIHTNHISNNRTIHECSFEIPIPIIYTAREPNEADKVNGNILNENYCWAECFDEPQSGSGNVKGSCSSSEQNCSALFISGVDTKKIVSVKDILKSKQIPIVRTNTANENLTKDLLEKSNKNHLLSQLDKKHSSTKICTYSNDNNFPDSDVSSNFIDFNIVSSKLIGTSEEDCRDNIIPLDKQATQKLNSTFNLLDTNSDDNSLIHSYVPVNHALRSTLMVVDDEDEEMPASFKENKAAPKIEDGPFELTQIAYPNSLAEKTKKLKTYAIQLLRSTSDGILERNCDKPLLDDLPI